MNRIDENDCTVIDTMNISDKNDNLTKVPGPRVIRAWFDTVINPLLDGLNLENRYIARHDWSWNHWRGKLESILPVVQHLGASVEPNLQQFCALNPELPEHISEHDRYVSAIWEKCAALQHMLQSNKAFEGLYRQATSQKVSEPVEQYQQREYVSRENVAAEEMHGALAEYIINNRELLPDFYTTSAIWNTWREQFLALLNDVQIKPVFDDLLEVGHLMSQSNSRLIDVLERKRSHLSLEYDVPIVLLNDAA